MTIGGKEYEQIIVTDTEGGVLALIDDEDIVEHEDCKVECVPSEAEPKPITWTGEYTRIETSELVKELSGREGVKTEIAEPYQDKAISVNGPAVILIVTD